MLDLLYIITEEEMLELESLTYEDIEREFFGEVALCQAA